MTIEKTNNKKMKLDLFQELADVAEDKLHTKFKLLRDEPTLIGEREIVINWTEGFEDRDNKIIKEFQTTFHSSFWEFYLFQYFSELNFEIDFTYNRPDFIVKNPINLLIEAVVSNIKKEGREESTRGASDIASMMTPPSMQEDFDSVLKESIVRNSNAILQKNKKYLEQYTKCNWVDEKTPFVIALSSYDQVNYGREYYYPLIALLYGLCYNPTKETYEVANEIVKPNTDSSIPIGLFNDEKMKHISAIIFSSTTTLGKLTSMSISKGSDCNLNRVINIRNDYEPPFYKLQEVSSENPEELSDGLFIFHNPNAEKKISKDLFSNSNIFQVTFENRKLMFEGENLPIVSRINMPKMFFPDFLMNMKSK